MWEFSIQGCLTQDLQMLHRPIKIQQRGWIWWVEGKILEIIWQQIYKFHVWCYQVRLH